MRAPDKVQSVDIKVQEYGCVMVQKESPEKLAALIYECVAGAYGSMVPFDNVHAAIKSYYITAADNFVQRVDDRLLDLLLSGLDEPPKAFCRKGDIELH